jgi:hypothetical protein
MSKTKYWTTGIRFSVVAYNSILFFSPVKRKKLGLRDRTAIWDKRSWIFRKYSTNFRKLLSERSSVGGHANDVLHFVQSLATRWSLSAASSDTDSVPLVTYLALWRISEIYAIFVEVDQYFCRKWQHELAAHPPETNSRPLSDERFPLHNFPTLATWNFVLGAMLTYIKLEAKVWIYRSLILAGITSSHLLPKVIFPR